MFIDKTKILKAKEKLGDKNAEIISELMLLQNYDEKNKKSLCPFHLENTPSFIYNSKGYYFHCFSCGKNLDLIDAYMQNNKTYLEAVELLFKEAKIPYSFGEKGVKTKQQYRYPREEGINDKEKIIKYLEKRKISKKTIDYADVREDVNGNIVFNYYDTNDVLTMCKYRPSHKIDKSKGEIKNWCQKDADTTPLLFNMNRINFDQPLLITEGEIDCLAAIESGYTNAVSVPFGAGNYTWIEENFDWLEKFDSIIICSDNDEAGVKMQKECVFRLGSWRTKFIEIPPIYITEQGKIIPMKDLNEVLYWEGRESVLALINNAKDSPVDSVADFSDIKDLDLDQIDGIKTGFLELDKKLIRLFYGTLTILTGVNGSGKSSWISQVICNALDEGKNAYLYSGELPNFQSKNWINYIFAGQRNVKEYETEDGAKYWKIIPEVKNEINEAYKNMLFIHKDGYSRTASTILKTIEDTTRKYGCKLHIIDNLTAINLECSDENKYQKQEEFVNSLIDLAKKYNVAIVLVVHPHKIETMRRLTKMDIQGISAIIDLAHRIISLYRVSKTDKQGEPKKNGGWYKEPIKYDMMLDILKDRMRGFEGSSCGFYYDRPSRRFFENERDLDRKYSWDKKEYNGDLPYPPEQLLEQNDEEVYGKIEDKEE